ncbi:MAG: hypothetical protein ABI603_04275 [Acidobacteriota bacterium]
MNIRDFMRTWLTNPELERRGGRYENLIASVGEETIRNRFTGTREAKPVITFSDGVKLILNVGMMRTLAAIFGDDTDTWVGHSIVVFQRRAERIDKKTGELRVRLERSVMASRTFDAYDSDAAVKTYGEPFEAGGVLEDCEQEEEQE